MESGRTLVYVGLLLGACLIIGALIASNIRSHRTDARAARSATSGLSVLAPLPPILPIPLQPGAPNAPGLIVRFGPRPLAEVSAALQQTKAALGVGLSDAELLAESGNEWIDALRAPPALEIAAIACLIDLRYTVVTGMSSGLVAEDIDRVCRALAERLGGRVEGSISRASIEQRHSELEAQFESGERDLTIELVSEAGYPAPLLLQRLGELGFVRGDIGSYAWNNPTNVGDDRLIVAVDSEYRGFYRTTADARYPGIQLSMQVDSVPLPELVLERMITAAEALRRALGGELRDSVRRPFHPETIREALRDRLGVLRKAGLAIEAQPAVNSSTD